MGTRGWSPHKQILVLLVSLVVLWAVAIGASQRVAPHRTTAHVYHDQARRPALELVTQLQQERKLSVVHIAGGRAKPTALVQQRTQTDVALATFRRLANSQALADAVTDLVAQRLGDLSTAPEMLAAARETVDRGEVDRTGAARLYTRMIDAAHRLLRSLADTDDQELARDGRAVAGFIRARDMLAQEDALLAGVAAAGRFTGTDHVQLVQTIGTQRERYADAVAELPEVDRAAYHNVAKSEAAIRLRAMEDGVVADGRTGRQVPVDMAQWRIAYDDVVGRLRDIELSAGSALTSRAQRTAGGTFGGLWLAGLLTLVAVLVFALWRGRSGALRASRLRAAARVPEPRPCPGLDELSVTIALRSQQLLHRQLALIDGMERRFTEPEDLEDVFRVDHLATRMRRHVEDLITLADALPGRGWHRPVPMINIIRGAMSEVEDYARVTTLGVPNVGLVGRAVGDTIHLLAELIENGTAFSPSDARVQVSGCLVPNGFVVEVEDRGVGMAAEAMTEANRRLAEPTSFEPAVDSRLGLYVVARLAARHGIRVSLRPSPYGGISAVVLVPPELVAVELGEPPAAMAVAARAAVAERVVDLGPTDAAAPHEPDSERFDAEPAGERVPAETPDEGLPRRIPQASLAAQLRDPPLPSAGERAPAGMVGASSAERTRARLSALQAGTALGRQRSPALDSGVAPPAPPAPAPCDEGAAEAGRHVG